MSGSRNRRNRDKPAGDLLKALRQERGLTRTGLLHALHADERFDADKIPAIKSLWNYEEEGIVPIEPYRFTLAQFYGWPVFRIWGPHDQRIRVSELVEAQVAA